MVSNLYLQERRADALKLKSLIDAGAKHNYNEIDLSVIRRASESPNGFAVVYQNCMVVCKKPNTSGLMVHHYSIFDI